MSAIVTPAMTEVKFLLDDVPTAVREAVERDVAERDVSLNDAVCEIVARRYGLAWESSGYPFIGAGGAKAWGLRMPAAMRTLIKSYARAQELTMRGCILLALTDHYGLPAVSPRKRRPRTKEAK